MSDITKALDEDFMTFVRSRQEYIFYQDRDTYQCRGNCKPIRANREDGSGVNVVKCVICNFDEILAENCLEILPNGKRCMQQGRYGGYCRYHRDSYYADVLKRELDNRINKIVQRFSLTEAKLHDYLYHRHVPRKTPKKQFVYFIKANNCVKIGYSVSPERRLEDLKRSDDKTIKPESVNMDEAVLLGKITGGRAVELFLHTRFNSRRIAGEWFTLDRKLHNKIMRILDEGDKDIEELLQHVRQAENVGG